MRELDAVLQGFLDREFESLDARRKSLFARVLDMPDPDIYAYLAQRSVPEDPEIAALFDSIRCSIRPPT